MPLHMFVLHSCSKRQSRSSNANFGVAAVHFFKISNLKIKIRVAVPAQVKQAVEGELKRNLTLKPFITPLPRPPTPNAEVRLNAAAIFREDALYRRRQAEEAAMLKQ